MCIPFVPAAAAPRGPATTAPLGPAQPARTTPAAHSTACAVGTAPASTGRIVATANSVNFIICFLARWDGLQARSPGFKLRQGYERSTASRTLLGESLVFKEGFPLRSLTLPSPRSPSLVKIAHFQNYAGRRKHDAAAGTILAVSRAGPHSAASCGRSDRRCIR